MAEVVACSAGRETSHLARWVRVTPYDVVRVLLAAILLAAAGLKGHQLATEPILGNGLLDSRWLLMATVEFELFFGLWLLANLWPRWTRLVALACFGAFACVSLYKALSGAASCGCFGRVEVNPWYTFTLDTLAVLALLFWRPLGRPSSLLQSSQVFWVRTTVVALVWLTFGIPAIGAMALMTPLSNSGRFAKLGQVFRGPDDKLIVVLEPEMWIGKECPLLSYIENCPGTPGLPVPETELRLDLKVGEWTVVLYRDGCSECRAFFERLEHDACVHNRYGKVATVQLPPYGANKRPLECDHEVSSGRIDDSLHYFVKTPVVLSMDMGVVRRIVTGDIESGLSD